MAAGDKVPDVLEKLVAPHVESYDYFLDEGMQLVVEGLEPLEIEHPVTKQVHRFWFENPLVGRPINEDAPVGSDNRLFPRDCREAGTTYKAPMSVDLCFTAGDSVQRIQRRLGGLPIMVKSSACYLRNYTKSQLVAAKEEELEFGGYFICNGIERIIRCLILQRRHYIMALRRSAYLKRGKNYTEAATLVRCVRPDQSSATVRCHYLTDGTVNFAFTMRRSEYFIPAGVLLKCFAEVSDKELYTKLTAGAAPGSAHAAFLAERAELLLTQAARVGLTTRARCIEYLGTHFRVILNAPARMSDHDIGEKLLRDYVFVHLSRPADKLAFLLQMLHKLYALVNRQCCEDNPDALTHHELLLPGHLLLKFVKERLEDSLGALRDAATKAFETNPEAVNLEDESTIKKLSERMPDIGKKVEYLLNTGNLVSRSGLDLSQAAGFTVVAEKLNFFRFLSHFRSVHRGAYFAELRTTTVRKLLPESWGFLCPVHTPDGSPCGLLNHFTAACRIVAAGPESPEDAAMGIINVLASLGMIPATTSSTPPPPPDYCVVMLDGRVVGYLRTSRASAVVSRLRALKAAALALEEGPGPVAAEGGDAGNDHGGRQRQPLRSNEAQIPSHLEVAYLPHEPGGPYGGLHLFSQAARMMRPVMQLRSGARELIGTLEQSNMDIACPDGGAGGSLGMQFTHAESSPMTMLSVVASMTPWSDYNQSPRNMYQCQMGKQTMGTPVRNYQHRTDTKLYRLQTPQTPIARTQQYDRYCMDDFPSGTNAIVAVLSYTGYDMEDAMIINKSSMERGFAHGSLHKTEQVNLREDRGSSKGILAAEPADARTLQSRGLPPRPTGAFGQQFPQNCPRLPSQPSASTSKANGAATPLEQQLVAMGAHREADRVDADGLPHVGSIIWPGQVYYSTQDLVSGKYKAHRLKGEEVARVEQVTLIGSKDKDGPQRANIQLTFNRNPVIGDKFSSRHGQKGVLSQLWPDVDMPYAAATGMRPDLIINPHAFPSRMTIGMLVESLAGKAGALQGRFVDATPFARCSGSTDNPMESFGEYLEQAGFSRHGQETMISGVTGEEMTCDIFVGLVYYQRLRHMVSDKFQVRSFGPINPLTRQPIKGRKMGGGIRFGEMERDSLLAHGAAYLLHDRLHACSDYSVMDVCTQCGSILSPLAKPAAVAVQGPAAVMGGGADAGKVVCRLCEGSRHIERVAMPYVFKYLAAELAAMNIRVSIGVK